MDVLLVVIMMCALFYHDSMNSLLTEKNGESQLRTSRDGHTAGCNNAVCIILS